MTRRDPRAGILSGPVDGPARARATYPQQTGGPGLRARHRATGFTGTVVRWEPDGVVLRGVAAWPEVPPGVDWKTGVCERLGIRAGVRSYADLEPALVGAVERLIDVVTEPP